MKALIKILSILSLLSILISCSSNDNKNLFSDRLDVTGGVDIWTSIQYEIISDDQIIKTIEPNVTEESYMLHFMIKLENRGEQTAESFHVVFKESKPLAYSNGSLNQGIDNGKLKRNEEYEVSGRYTFDNMEQLEEFVNNSNLTIEWMEEEIMKEMILKLPGKPTQ